MVGLLAGPVEAHTIGAHGDRRPPTVVLAFCDVSFPGCGRNWILEIDWRSHTRRLWPVGRRGPKISVTLLLLSGDRSCVPSHSHWHVRHGASQPTRRNATCPAWPPHARIIAQLEITA